MTKEKGYPPTRELDRMRLIKDDSQKIGGFLEWLDEQAMFLAVYHEHQGNDGLNDEQPTGCWQPHVCRDFCGCRRSMPHDYNPSKCPCRGEADKVCGYANGALAAVSLSKEKILAKYFDIDLDKAEREKRNILEWIWMSPKEREKATWGKPARKKV